MKRREFLPFFIAILFVLLCASLATAAEIVQIGTPAELAAFRDRVNGGEVSLDAKLTADIDLTGVDWTPIGIMIYETYALQQGTGYSLSDDFSYRGTFDGNGQTVTGLKQTKANAVPYDMSVSMFYPVVGLFGIIGSDDEGVGTVKSLIVANADVTNVNDTSINEFTSAGVIAGMNMGLIADCIVEGGEVYAYFAGGIAGQILDGTIENCTVRNVSGIEASSRAGGVAGRLSRGLIANCSVFGIANIKGAYSAGGIAGDNYATTGAVSGGLITNCLVSRITKIEGDRAGGITGHNKNTVAFCMASEITEIKGDYIGGLVGYNDESASKIQNSMVSNLALSGRVDAGGLAGAIIRSALVENCTVSDVRVSASNSSVSKYEEAYSGALVGLSTGIIRGCVAASMDALSVSAALVGNNPGYNAYAGGAIGYSNHAEWPATVAENCVYPAGIVDTSGIFSAPSEWAIGNVAPGSVAKFSSVKQYASADAPDTLSAIVAVVKQGFAVTVKKGETISLDVTTLPGTDGDYTCAWQSSDDAVATVTPQGEKGLVVALCGVEKGVTNMTCTITGTTLNAVLTCAVTVVEEMPDDIDLTDITLNVLNGGTVALRPGGTFQINVTPVPATAPRPQPIYETTSDSIATVSATGLVTAVGEGEATIAVTVETDGDPIVKTFTVVVDEETPIDLDFTDIVLNVPGGGTITLNPDGTFQITFTTDPANASQPLPTYDTSDGSVAIISATGLVTAVGEGTATIEVTVTTLGGQTITKTFTVVVHGSGTSTGDGSGSSNCSVAGFGFALLLLVPSVLRRPRNARGTRSAQRKF